MTGRGDGLAALALEPASSTLKPRFAFAARCAVAALSAASVRRLRAPSLFEVSATFAAVAASATATATSSAGDAVEGEGEGEGEVKEVVDGADAADAADDDAAPSPPVGFRSTRGSFSDFEASGFWGPGEEPLRLMGAIVSAGR
jgi:hypothetical protein